MAQGPSLYYVRHGRSTWNDIAQELEAKGVSTKGHQLRWDLEYLDAPLCPKGVLQAEEAAGAILDIPFEKVFVSPLRRALHTCKIMFQGHPSHPQIIVHPILSERLNNANDVSLWEGEPYEGYESFDWSLMPPTNYQLEMIENDYTRDLKGRPSREVHQVLMERASRIYPAKLESKYECRHRTNLGKFIWASELAKTSNNIAVVGHSYYFRQFTYKDTPTGPEFKTLGNCEVYRVPDFAS